MANPWQQVRGFLNALFNRKKPKPVPALRPVVDTKHLEGYCGTVRSGARTKYYLYLSKIAPADRIALLGQGFNGVAGRWPTHWISCTHELFVYPGEYRTLFDVVLGLDAVQRPAQDIAAKRILKILKRSLETCPDTRFVIRKKTPKEFNWPQEDGQLAEYWLIEAGRAYKSVMGDMARMGLLVDGDRTEIQ